MSYILELRKIVGKRPLHMPSAVVLLFNPENQLLLQHRTDNRLWGLNGGAIEPGEPPESAARREFLEETGMRVEALHLLQVYGGQRQFVEYPNGDQVWCLNIAYLAVSAQQVQAPDPEETLDLQYFDLEALPTDLHASDQEVLEDLRNRWTEVQNILAALRNP
ncbi:hypothetical protein COW36_04315 [bacterium (Candidatus Blackallbacteria) CG17_big_fil_post_rev_8_21_14_2_50_48_46]|uniref:Nudix hydrolase domain-containing protein n=1 Tax=bacterium (Candidatus Blackallbacteria) CG17_big_fil_post_rev_8_21_14_2_50_48_46 TaxID=2014261 RepID=A0A2M7G8V0_9BACT|nr:MAG: hypothetical protein COW64_04630 [bacterium (Candidatus Blackallbacteria) CG18_big_fil_WC_8_21_14_2_50_49_26]PIW18523.1 MAG: hypothetical protein COW36_04315 [bacterium (Candidatus Blackallbacteria) CG17_big_fil_post_rev_8_21_14_2_50_48_46]PIW46492.1 MAG: hypothetical protein COW20_16365 [bacterium (Candidatus Blackallbacteria) CG13_big_fil_rev_8_21_14_2_50_49_14]